MLFLIAWLRGNIAPRFSTLAYALFSKRKRSQLLRKISFWQVIFFTDKMLWGLPTRTNTELIIIHEGSSFKLKFQGNIDESYKQHCFMYTLFMISKAWYYQLLIKKIQIGSTHEAWGMALVFLSWKCENLMMPECDVTWRQV